MHKPSAFSQMIQDAGVQLCVYGHIHGEDWHRQAFQGIRAGTTYRLVAADFLNMTPALVATLNDGHLTVHQPSSA
jgi:predicted phosphohydrolase